MKDILVGYEIGSGEPINVEATHMVVTGITNQSGKTTLLEGMASRANGFRFLVFKTKPHEQQFVTANEVKPFFRERCLVAGTKVISNPRVKNIEALQVGDKVLDSTGSFTKVVDTFVNDFQGDMVLIKPHGLPEIQMTQNHPLLVAERITIPWRKGNGHYGYSEPKWVLAMDLRKNHYLLIPRIKIEQTFQIDLRPYLKRGLTGVKGSLEITTDEDIAWMLGLYLADGGSWIGKKERGFVRFYLGPQEVEKAQKLQRIFTKHGFHPTTRLRKCLEVHVKSIPFARFLREAFSSGAKNKTIPHFVYLLPKNQIKNFIQGWLDGDGCAIRNGRYDRLVGITVSEDIAYGLSVLGAKLGIPVSVSYSKAPKSSFPPYKSSARWCIEIAGDYAVEFGFSNPRRRIKPRKAIKVDENYLYLPIRKISLQPFNGKVYNIETEAHNYCIPFVSHNTDWEYVAGILEASRNERMKFERFWIMRASKGADSLRIVDKNCVKLMEDEKEGGLAYSMYYQLHEYFKNILPELEGWNLGDNFPVLAEGINVMDLGEMSDGVQMLIIESCLAHILKNEKRLITLIPELWKVSPEGKRSPVKEHLDRLIRQGAAGKNFVWFDSQDMANVDKAPLKQCYTWVCLPPGQLIRTENGWKPIELIKEGESVLTHSGQFRHVTKAMSREYEGDIVEVRAYGHFATLRLTPEHPILASQVMLRDKNIWYYTSRVSGNRIQHIKQLTRPSVRWLNAGDISTENVLLTPRLKLKIEDHPPPILKPRLKGRWKRYGPSIPMSKDLFVLFGWYLAEGFVHDRYITFTLGSSKTELMYAGEICAAAKSLSFNATLDIHNGQIRVRLFGNSLAEFVAHNFGQYAYGKKIPAWALAQPKENLDALLSSYTKGDGHLHRGQDYTVSTVSYELAHGIRDVCLALGFPAWIRVIEEGQQRFPNGHISRIRRKYILGYSRNQERAQFRTRKGRLGIDDDYEYLRIKSVRRAKYSGPVYNLAVEGDESYTTEAFVVHNCGLQTERNEIKHTLDQINVPKKAKPTTDQVASLTLGQFYLSTPKGVKHFYAAPIWLPADKAILVAKGELASDQKEISDFKESYESEVQALHKGNLSGIGRQNLPSDPSGNTRIRN